MPSRYAISIIALEATQAIQQVRVVEHSPLRDPLSTTVQSWGFVLTGAVERLRRAGVQASHCAEDIEVAQELQAWGLQPAQVLAIGGRIPGTCTWQDVAQQVAEQHPNPTQIMQAIVQHNRRHSTYAQGQQQQSESADPACPLLVVGYVMKASREEQLCSAGLLHLLPQDNMCFMPIDLTCLDNQQGHIDILLHKGSDELVTSADGEVTWSDNLLRLQDWVAGQSHICVVDPFPNTKKVLDRVELGKLLDQLHTLQLPGGVRARTPRYLQLQDFSQPDFMQLLQDAGMQPPFIVKPVVACGVKHSHSMALVLQAPALQLLEGQLPVPAVVQEFVNHGGQQYKVYVMGNKVFVTLRASIPDVYPNPDLPLEQQLLFFDSLGSLPTQLPDHLTHHQQPPPPPQQQQQSEGQQGSKLHMPAVEAVAAFLRSHLGLNFFGFDVVVACGAGDDSSRVVSLSANPLPDDQQEDQEEQQSHQSSCEFVVIDVNYFPNYRGGTDTPSLFRATLRQCWEQQQQQHKRDRDLPDDD